MRTVQDIRAVAGRIHPGMQRLVAIALAHGDVLGDRGRRMLQRAAVGHPSGMLPRRMHKLGIHLQGLQPVAYALDIGLFNNVPFDWVHGERVQGIIFERGDAGRNA